MYYQTKNNNYFGNIYQNGSAPREFLNEEKANYGYRGNDNSNRTSDFGAFHSSYFTPDKYHPYNNSRPGFNGRNTSLTCKRPFKNGGYKNHCKTCDWNFNTKEAYSEHIETHVKCPDENCKYEAQKDRVEFHFRIEHMMNFADKMKHLDTPEEIERWRNERRKNFPTARRIQEKIQHQNDKISRGELLKNRDFSKVKNKRYQRNSNEDIGNIERKQTTAEPNSTEPLSSCTKSTRPTQKRKRKRLPRSCQFFRKDHQSSDDDETSHSVWGTKRFQGVPIQEKHEEEGEITDSDRDDNQKLASGIKSAPSALLMLSQCYESSDDEAQEVPEKPLKSELPLDLPPVTVAEEPATAKNVDVDGNKRTMKTPRRRFKKRHNLLEMLLAPDIRHERNVILQCIRHIINNNFFNEKIDNNHDT